jgi:predicted RecA/RadA family phage recombinase
MSVTPKPIEVFFSYSHKDEELRDELEKHLSILRRQGVITGWHDRRIGAGKEWEGEIDEHLNTADVILLLISADFLASDYCYDKEMRRALERHDAGEARVIPVILRPVDWEGASFGKLQALPKDAKPVTDWPNRDKAFLDIARGIRTAVEELAGPSAPEVEPAPAERERLRPPTAYALPPSPPVQAKRRPLGLSWMALGLFSLAIVIMFVVVAVGTYVYTQWEKEVAGLPLVLINSPVSGSHVQVGQVVIVQATATDSKGVTRVELLVNGVLYHSDVSPSPQGQSPFISRQSWQAPSSGTYTLVVKAYNAAGRVSQPAAITVNVAEAATPTPTEAASVPPTDTPTPADTPITPSPKPLPTTATKGKIAYTIGLEDQTRYQIGIINADGSGQTILPSLYISSPSFSPDGERIVFFAWQGWPQGSGLWTLKVDGTNPQLVVRDEEARNPRWSPDGKLVAYAARNSVHVISANGGDPNKLVDGSIQPSWSPDSQRLVFKGCDGPACGLYLMNIDGSGKARLTTTADDTAPAWSPDGSQVVFACKAGDTWDICTVNIDGSDRKSLTANNPENDVNPVWLPDSSGIVFLSARQGKWEVWVMNADGSGQRKLIDAAVTPDWGVISLDTTP